MYYIGNPIILSTSAQQVDASATFHRVVATISMTGIASVGQVIKQQSQPVSSIGQTMRFDIAPTLKAYAAHFDYAPIEDGGVFQVPNITSSVTFHDEYMISGRIVTGAERNPAEGSTLTASIGHYTDMERLHNRLPGSLTIKPNDNICPQLVAAPALCAVPTAATASQPRQSVSTRVDLPAMHAMTLGTEATYVVPMDARIVQFQFVNSRGMLETIHAFCAMKEDIKTSSQTYVRAVPETLGTISRRLVVNDEGYPTLSMSSGYCSEAWARWWAFEFCRANKVWMLVPDTTVSNSPSSPISGIWVPCSVTLKDGATIIDHAKATLPHIDFDVVPDINGPM